MSSCTPKDPTTLFVYQPCDWEREAVIEAAWQLYDKLGEGLTEDDDWSEVVTLFPLCPWCGYECALERNTPVPLNVDRVRAEATCLGCEKDFVLTHNGWEEAI
jgi:hypothetical protein